MARQQPNHRHDCRCNACVRRRNARRRLEADRYSEEGRPLPQGSQLYEIERDLPVVYDSRSMEVQDTVEHVPNRTSRPIPPANFDDYLDRPTRYAPFVLPPSLAREEARRDNRRAWSLIIFAHCGDGWRYRLRRGVFGLVRTRSSGCFAPCAAADSNAHADAVAPDRDTEPRRPDTYGLRSNGRPQPHASPHTRSHCYADHGSRRANPNRARDRGQRVCGV